MGGALGGASGDVGGGGVREKDLEEEVASLREQLSHLQDEYTQAGLLLLVCVLCEWGNRQRQSVVL